MNDMGNELITPMDFNDIGEKRKSKIPAEGGHIYYFDTWEVAQSWLRGDMRKARSEDEKRRRAKERECRKAKRLASLRVKAESTTTEIVKQDEAD